MSYRQVYKLAGTHTTYEYIPVLFTAKYIENDIAWATYTQSTQ